MAEKMTFKDFFNIEVNKKLFKEYIGMFEEYNTKTRGLIKVKYKDFLDAVVNYYEVVVDIMGDFIKDNSVYEYFEALFDNNLIPADFFKV